MTGCRASSLAVLSTWLLLAPAPPATAQEQTLGPEHGTLVIAGGGGRSIEAIFRRFVELAGGEQARIVIVPTAASSERDYDYEHPRALGLARDELGLKNVTVVHTHDRTLADTQGFVEPISRADGVWFGGGRQWRLADAYLGTRSEREFHRVLSRGGVIGGSSAGASIQASFLVRGDTRGNRILIGNHQRGFGFIRNSAIDQHVVTRKRQRALIEVLSDPDRKMIEGFDSRSLLGIGIDEDTAIVVQGNQFEVIGKEDGSVLVYDASKWTVDTPTDVKYLTLKTGDRYDMQERTVVEGGKLPAPAKKSPDRTAGDR